MTTTGGQFTHFSVHDVRFPTSVDRDGSDALNADPDYSTAYVVVHTSAGDRGHGFVFTIGRGTEVAVAAIRAVEPLVAGLEVDEVLSDLGGFWRRLVRDSHLRWLGPEKGVVHMAIGAVVNAVWDLYARRQGMPLWQALGRLEPERLVDLIDFRHLSDVLDEAEALEILRGSAAGARTGSGRCCSTDIRRTRHPRAGWATPTRRWPGWCQRRCATASSILPKASGLETFAGWRSYASWPGPT